jgi:hypothetical protein
MGTINRHVRTDGPHHGLGPYVLNLPVFYQVYPKASNTNNVYTKTQQTAGSSDAAGTDVDYPRNLNVVITPTASSAGVTGGGVSIYGRDIFGRTLLETFNSLAISAAAGQSGSLNFARIDTISQSLSFLAATSSAASAFAVNVGVGPKLGLPFEIRSTNPVFQVHIGTAAQRTSAGASSTDNQYTCVTGAYSVGGIRFSSAFSTNSLFQVGYNVLGRSAPAPIIDN